MHCPAGARWVSASHKEPALSTPERPNPAPGSRIGAAQVKPDRPGVILASRRLSWPLVRGPESQCSSQKRVHTLRTATWRLRVRFRPHTPLVLAGVLAYDRGSLIDLAGGLAPSSSGPVAPIVATGLGLWGCIAYALVIWLTASDGVQGFAPPGAVAFPESSRLDLRRRSRRRSIRSTVYGRDLNRPCPGRD